MASYKVECIHCGMYFDSQAAYRQHLAHEPELRDLIADIFDEVERQSQSEVAAYAMLSDGTDCE